jgi:hypothetical protein
MENKVQYHFEDFMSLAARRKASLPDDYFVSSWEMIDKETYLISISKTKRLTRGKRKGQLVWRDNKKKMFSEAVRTIITLDDYNRERSLYEKETGKCYGCSGNGMEFAGVSVDEGERVKLCRRCGGNGEAILKLPFEEKQKEE